MATPYHRLARETPEHAWWKLPVAGLLALLFYFAAASLLMAVAVLVMYAAGADGLERIGEWFEASGELDRDRPDFFVLDMLGLAIMIPAILLAVLVTGPRRIGYLTSVAGRMRWSWLGRTSVLAAIVFGGGIAALVGLSFWLDPGSVSEPSMVDGRVVVLLVLVVAITPFQAAAEEYVFRGYILQLVGSWTRFAWIPVVVSVPIFAAGHEYNLWGLIDVGLFGLMAAVLVIRTGGLEAAIAAHAFNNIAILIFEALGMLEDSDGGGPIDLVPSIVMNVLFFVLVERALRRSDLDTTRPPIAPPPAPVWTPAPVPVAPSYQPPPEWIPPPNTPPYPGYLPPGWRPPRA